MSKQVFNAGVNAAESLASAAKRGAADRLNQEINDSMVRMRTGVTIEEQTQIRKKMFESGVASLSADDRSKIGIVLSDAQKIQVISHDREQFAQQHSKDFGTNKWNDSMNAAFRADSVQKAVDSGNFNYDKKAFASQKAAEDFRQNMQSQGFYSLNAVQENGQWVVQTAISVNVPSEDGTKYDEYAIAAYQDENGNYSFSTIVDGYNYTTATKATETSISDSVESTYFTTVDKYNEDAELEDKANEYQEAQAKDERDIYDEERDRKRREAESAFGYMASQFGSGVGELGWVLREGKDFTSNYAAPFIRDANAEHLLHSNNPFTEKATVVNTKSGDKLVYVKGNFQGRINSKGAFERDKGANISQDQGDKIAAQDFVRHDTAKATIADLDEQKNFLKEANSSVGRGESQKFENELQKRNADALTKKQQAEIDAFKFHTTHQRPKNAISAGIESSEFKRRQFMARMVASKRNKNIKETAASIENGVMQTYNIDALKEVALVSGGYATMLEEQLRMQQHAFNEGGQLNTGTFQWFKNNGMVNADGSYDIDGFRNKLFDAANDAGIDIGGIKGFDAKKIGNLSNSELARIAKNMGEGGISVENLKNSLDGFAKSSVVTGTGFRAGQSMLSLAQQAIGDEDLNEMMKHGSNAVRYGKKGYNIGKDFATSVSYQREALLKRKAAQGSEVYKKKLEQFQANKAKHAAQRAEFAKGSNSIGRKVESAKARFAQTIERNKFLRGVNKYNPFAVAEKAKRKAAQAATKRLMNSKAGQALAKLAAKAAAKLGLASTGVGAVVAVAWEALEHWKELAAAAIVKFAVGAAGMIMPVLCGFILLAFVTLNIAGLFEDDDPESYTKTAAYALSKDMQKAEDVWLKALQDGLKDDGLLTTTTFEKKDELDWGWDNESFEDYIKHFKNLEYKDKKLYINPFWKVEGLASLGDDEHEESNKDALTPVEEFDGKKTAELYTNPNVYSELEVKNSETETAEPEEESYKDETVERRFAEDGHTSNIRDVLAMTDIMYTHEPEENEDETLKSIFDEAPSYYTLQWWDGFVKNFLGTIISWFTGEEYKPIPLVKYSTIQNYTTHLLAYSHSQVYTIDVSYYNKDAPMVKYDGEEMTLPEAFEKAGEWDLFANELTDSDAAKLGFCKNPKEIKFEIDIVEEYSELPDPDTEGDITNGVINGEITPVIKDNDGNMYGLRKDGRFDVTVTLDDIKEGEEPCLWDDMGNDEATYKKIRSNDCWSGGNPFGVAQTMIGGDMEINQKIQEINSKITANNGCTYFLKDKNTFEVNKILQCIQIGVNPFTGETTWFLQYFEETWTRSCHKHTFVYSAGQLDLNSIGLIWSMWNEHMVIGAGQYPDDYCNPVYLKATAEDNGLREPDIDGLADIGFEDVIGKVDLENADTSNGIATYVSTTKGKSPVEDAQGSWVGNEKGINFYLKDEDWAISPDGKGRWLTEDEDKELLENRLKMRDIFDIDMFIPKGYNIFPYNKDEWSDYESWSDDNILLASTRLTGDWYEYFNFDIPSEIGERTLAEEDIDKILEEIKKTGCLSEGDNERETIVKTALFWVGHGHYSAYHSSENTDHQFLTNVCTVMKQTPEGAAEGSEGVGWDMTSTASDSEGFAHWLYHIADKSDKIKADGGSSYSGYSDLKSGDVVVHKGYEPDESTGCLDLTIFDLNKQMIKNFDADAVNSYTRNIYSVYIGKTQEKIRTKGNQEIPANSVLFVQMDTNGMFGTVRLRWTQSSGYFDHARYTYQDGLTTKIIGDKNKKGIFTDPFEIGDSTVANNYKNGKYDPDTYEITEGTFDATKDYNRYNYYWLSSPDENTKAIKFDN